MKKLTLIFAAFLFITISLRAQEDEQSITPAGPFAVDMTFDPAAIFDAGAGPLFEMPVIKARYFMSSDVAIRVGLGLGLGTEKDYLDANGDNYTKTSSSFILVAAGIEKHFGTGKFSPYVGGQLSVSNYSDKVVTNIGGTSTTNENPNGYIGLGLNAVFGADLYLLPSFYIGAEFAPGFMFSKDKDETLDGTVVTTGGSSMNFDLASVSGVKIGFRF